MTDGGQHRLQILLSRLGGAGEVQNQGPFPDARLRPGQHGPAGDLHGGIAHGLRDAGSQPVAHGKGGLRGHVPGSEAGAAGGHKQLNVTIVGHLPQRRFDLHLFVRHHIGPNYLIACVFQQLCHQRAALVRALAPGNTVADRQYSSMIHTLISSFQQ